MAGPGDDGQRKTLIATEYTEFDARMHCTGPVQIGMLAVSDAAWLRLIWL